MTTYQKKKCPHCNFIYARHTFAGGRTKRNGIFYGSILRTCPQCRKSFVDKDYREIAIDGIKPEDKYHITPGSVIIYGFLVFIGISCCVSYRQFAGLILVGIGTACLINEYLGYDKRQKSLEEERAASEKRLQVLPYALLLKKIGYQVPDQYLVQKITGEDGKVVVERHFSEDGTVRKTVIMKDGKVSKVIMQPGGADSAGKH